MIYTVTTLRKPSAIDSSRTPGFFPTLEEAKECVEGNWMDIHETSYEYVVIEEFDSGLYYLPPREKEWWYKWEWTNFEKREGRYLACDKPKEITGVRCFGLG